MTEEQKATYRQMIECGRKMVDTSIDRACLAALEACWADRERAVTKLRFLRDNDHWDSASHAGECLKSMGEP